MQKDKFTPSSHAIFKNQFKYTKDLSIIPKTVKPKRRKHREKAP
jgi:hypothetical protein